MFMSNQLSYLKNWIYRFIFFIFFISNNHVFVFCQNSRLTFTKLNLLILLKLCGTQCIA